MGKRFEFNEDGIEPRYIPTDEYLELDELAACYRVVMRVMTDGYK